MILSVFSGDLEIAFGAGVNSCVHAFTAEERNKTKWANENEEKNTQNDLV